MCYGKHKVLPLLWMARDTAKFDRPDSYLKVPPEESKSLLLFYYRGHQHQIHQFKMFLELEDSQLFKNWLGTEISQLISDGKEIDKIFNAAFNSLIKFYRHNRNKIMLKIIIKPFIPDWMLNYLKKSKTTQHMSGIDQNCFSNIALNNIRLSVLSFPDVYSNTRGKQSFKI
jgi:hypothetical protein